MTTRRLRILLTATATGLTLVAAGIVAWVLVAPPASHTAASAPGRAASEGTVEPGPAIAARPKRDALLARADRPLRVQLFDPPPPPPEQPPPTPPLPGIELISTILPSNGEPSAWVRESATGNTPRKVRVGDTLGPADNTATVTGIEPDRLLVEHNGETHPIERASATSGRRR